MIMLATMIMLISASSPDSPPTSVTPPIHRLSYSQNAVCTAEKVTCDDFDLYSLPFVVLILCVTYAVPNNRLTNCRSSAAVVLRCEMFGSRSRRFITSDTNAHHCSCFFVNYILILSISTVMQVIAFEEVFPSKFFILFQTECPQLSNFLM
jgi:hypothetical protein